MRACERCGEGLGFQAMLGAVADRTGDLFDAEAGKHRGDVVCRCGAVHRPIAPLALGLLGASASLAGAFGLLWLLADAFDRHTAYWSPDWRAAALLLVFAVPALTVLLLLTWLWPLRFVAQTAPSVTRGRLTTGMLFESFLVLGFAGLALGLTDGFGPLSAFVLAVAGACLWLSNRRPRRGRHPAKG